MTPGYSGAPAPGPVTPISANPFPGAVAGVYEVADAADAVATLTGKADYSIAYQVSGPSWVQVGGSVVRITTPNVADASEIPVAVSGETLASGLTTTDGADTVWTFGILGFSLWVRTHTAAIASPAALPTPITGEAFAPGLRTNAGGIQWWWDSSNEWWVRAATPDVANAAALPSPASGEVFSDGVEFEPALACFVINPGVMYRWNGSGWDA